MRSAILRGPQGQTFVVPFVFPCSRVSAMGLASSGPFDLTTDFTFELLAGMDPVWWASRSSQAQFPCNPVTSFFRVSGSAEKLPREPMIYRVTASLRRHGRMRQREPVG